MNTKFETVCFSGHRILYDPREFVEQQLYAAIQECIANGKISFMTGGALGFDTIAAKAVIGLRTENPMIRLVLALPCPAEEQTLKWNKQQIEEYKSILEQADEVKVLSPHYTNGCMLSRNRYMVDNRSTLIYYLRNPRSETKYTVNYAQSKDIKLIIEL